MIVLFLTCASNFLLVFIHYKFWIMTLSCSSDMSNAMFFVDKTVMECHCWYWKRCENIFSSNSFTITIGIIIECHFLLSPLLSITILIVPFSILLLLLSSNTIFVILMELPLLRINWKNILSPNALSCSECWWM